MPTLALVLWITVTALVVAVIVLTVLVLQLRRQLRTCARAPAVHRALLLLTKRHRELSMAHQRVARRLPVSRRAYREPDWSDDDLDTRVSDTGETFLPVSFEQDLW